MNLARFVIEGSVAGVSPAENRGFDAAAGEGLAFRLEDGASNRVQSFQIQVYSPTNTNSPRCTKGAPLLTLVGKTSGQSVEAATPSADITTTMPGSGVHGWMVVATVNGGVNADGVVDPNYRFARMVVMRTGAGTRKMISLEATEYQPEGWAEAYNELVDLFQSVSTPEADQVGFDPKDSGLASNNVGGALRELGARPAETPTLGTVLQKGQSAADLEITDLGAPQSPSSAARLSDVTDAVAGLASESWVAAALEGLATEVYADGAASAALSAAQSYTDAAVSSVVVPEASDATPQALGTAASGSSEAYSRADHVHQLPAIPAASSTLPAALGTADAGSSAQFARGDHVHPLPAIPAASSATPQPVGDAAVGTSAQFARADHVHALPDSAVLPPMLAPATRTGRTIVKEISENHTVTDDDYVIAGVAYDPAQNELMFIVPPTGGLTITLPESPVLGQRIQFVKTSDTTPQHIIRANTGQLIQSTTIGQGVTTVNFYNNCGLIWSGIWANTGISIGYIHTTAIRLAARAIIIGTGAAGASSMTLANGQTLICRSNALQAGKISDLDSEYVSPDGKFRVQSVAPSARQSATVPADTTFSAIVPQLAFDDGPTWFRTRWCVRVNDALLEFLTTSHRLDDGDPVGLQNWVQLIGPPLALAGITIEFVAVTDGVEVRVFNGSAASLDVSVFTQQQEEYA